MRCSRRSFGALAGLVVVGAALLLLRFEMGARRASAAAQDAAAAEKGEAENRAECVNNLKRIGLALHNYHSAHGAFPGNIVDKEGKPLLSWRVAILPYMDQSELYNKFKLDEPWDGPHNKPLLKEMPKFLRCPSRPQGDPTETHYLGFEGPRTMFEPGAKVEFEDVVDGTSNTLAVVEADEGVPWTKPADLPFDYDAPASLYGAGSKHPNGFEALKADGSIRFIKTSINPPIFKALITRNGGEVVGPDTY